MFPSHLSRTFTALLEVADAILAPAPEQPHPHARRAVVEIARRPAPPSSAGVCLAPLPPRTAAGRRERQRSAL